MITESLESNYILGYAIIQIPDFLLFLYGVVKSFDRNRTSNEGMQSFKNEFKRKDTPSSPSPGHYNEQEAQQGRDYYIQREQNIATNNHIEGRVPRMIIRSTIGNMEGLSAGEETI